MSNKYIDSSLLDKAIIFAVKAHANTERKGKGIPYIVHPMEAVNVVATLTNSQELMAAAALHDVVEDAGVSLEEIEREFGRRVRDIVCAESEKTAAGDDKSKTWHARKQDTLDRLKAANEDTLIVAMGDKLSNIRTLAHDYEIVGEALWSRFRAPKGKEDMAWYYTSLAQLFTPLSGTDAYKEYMYHLARIFGK